MGIIRDAEEKYFLKNIEERFGEELDKEINDAIRLGKERGLDITRAELLNIMLGHTNESLTIEAIRIIKATHEDPAVSIRHIEKIKELLEKTIIGEGGTI